MAAFVVLSGTCLAEDGASDGAGLSVLPSSGWVIGCCCRDSAGGWAARCWASQSASAISSPVGCMPATCKALMKAARDMAGQPGALKGWSSKSASSCRLVAWVRSLCIVTNMAFRSWSVASSPLVRR